MTASPRRLEYLRVRDLQPNPNNPKKHDQAGISASMTRFGFIEPIVVDERTGWLVSGHGRVEALTAEEHDGSFVPDGIALDDDGAWLAPVIRGWASTDDDEADAATVALNRWTERGGWDEEKLLGQLQTLDSLIGVGFDQAAMDDLIARIQERANPADPDPGPVFGDPDRQIRSLMLDLPLDQYRWAAETCARARQFYEVDSNAALFLALLREDATR